MFNLKLKEANSKNGSVVVEIENDSQKPIRISNDTILLDGFTSNKFHIKDKNTGEVLEYKGSSKKYRPEETELKEHEKLASELDLKEVYNLEKCHQYDISFKTVAVTEIGYENLVGILNIEMECE